MSSKKYLMTILNCMVLISISIFIIDSYLPSLPHIAAEFKTDHGLVKLSVSLLFIGYGIAPLIYGPLSDIWGRKKILCYTSIIGLLGCLICMISTDINILILGRIILGIGIAAGPSIGRAIARDITHGKKLSKLSSYFGIIIGAMPMIAPAIGGNIQEFFGWRYNFVLIFILLSLSFAFHYFYLPETISTTKGMRIVGGETKKYIEILSNYLKLLKNWDYMIHPLCGGLCFAAIISYITVAPFLFQDVLKLSAIQFGYLTMISGVCIILGSMINGFLIKKYSMQSLLKLGSFLFLLGGVLMYYLGVSQHISVFNIMLPISILTIGMQFIFANSFSICMSVIKKEMSGAASSLYNAIQMLLSAVFSTFTAFLHMSNQIPLAYILIFLSGLTFVLVNLTSRREMSTDEQMQTSEAN